MNELGIAIWGLGNHAINRIIPALDSFVGLNLIGVCSRTEKTVTHTAKKWNCLGWIDPDEMLMSSDVDIIYIALPIGIHFESSMRSLIAGKHVWCEKPMTCDHEDTKSLIEFARENNKMLAEGFMYLYHPQLTRVKNFIQSGSNNHIRSIICRFGIPNLKNPGFRLDPNLGGGAFWDVGSYTVSALIALYPEEDVEVLFSNQKKNQNSLVDTEGRVLLDLSNGVSVFLEWCVGVSYKNDIELWSQNGSFYTDKIFSKSKDYKPIYRIRDLNGEELEDYGEASDQFYNMFDYFFKAIKLPDKIELEYDLIEKRSKVMDKILRLSNNNSK
jgi:dTDP-3,4-didehydro-2,6-dideoxy-alpha-D-glucose 3-reductase